MRTNLLRFNGAVERDRTIAAWMEEHAGELGAIARQWFGRRSFMKLLAATPLFATIGTRSLAATVRSTAISR